MGHPESPRREAPHDQGALDKGRSRAKAEGQMWHLPRASRALGSLWPLLRGGKLPEAQPYHILFLKEAFDRWPKGNLVS